MPESNRFDKFSFSDEQRSGVYRAIHQRRDVRSYLPDPVAPELLWRLLDAAHAAPSVGFMQPWNFILIEQRSQKERLYDHFLSVNRAAAESYSDDKARSYAALKLQGILDAPLSLVVTCDRRRGGNVLGRHSIRDTDLYSTSLAIENLWLAARSEGLGVGWVSLYQPESLAAELTLPEGVVAVALLTLGWPVALPERPLLESIGWRKRLELESLVGYGGFGVALPEHLSRPSSGPGPGPGPGSGVEAAAVRSNGECYGDYSAGFVATRLAQLTKPLGSLGRLEPLLERLASIQRCNYPSVEQRSLWIFAADHGICAEGVSAWRSEVTAKMVYQILAETSASAALARRHQLDLRVVDVGVDHDFGEASGLIDRKIARGSKNFLYEAALSDEQFRRALAVGEELLLEELSRRSGSDESGLGRGRLDLIILGEMGIGNSSSATALTAALMSLSHNELTGPGAGLGPGRTAHKVEVLTRALRQHADVVESGDPVAIGRTFGGFEIVAMAGMMVAAAREGVVVLLDGVIVGAAALLAARLAPGSESVFVAAHLSAEPAHRRQLEALGVEPLLSLELSLGEGTGALLALDLLDSICRLYREMKTFREANIDRLYIDDHSR